MAQPAFTYDISQLEKMFAEMSDKERRKALRGSMRLAGRKLKKEAEKIAGLKMKPSKKVSKGIRVVVYKKVIGVRVTVAPPKRKKKTGLAFYMEIGTKPRKYYSTFRNPRRKAHPTGVFSPRPFMEETKNRVAPKMTKEMTDSVIEHIQKIARKYGCK